ncbi:hypothetical protein Btru_066215 [Bulinus truncatus]|nr:hypothetical protein Btru_066215 [Bulinus truncatus]
MDKKAKFYTNDDSSDSDGSDEFFDSNSILEDENGVTGHLSDTSTTEDSDSEDDSDELEEPKADTHYKETANKKERPLTQNKIPSHDNGSQNKEENVKLAIKVLQQNNGQSCKDVFPRWHSENNLPEKKCQSEQIGKYVWQTSNKTSGLKRHASIEDEKPVPTLVEQLKQSNSNTIASEKKSLKEASSKERTFVWHGSSSTHLLTKGETSVSSVRNIESVPERHNFLKAKLNSSELNLFKNAARFPCKPAFTWNVNSQNIKKHSDICTESLTHRKPSDLYKENIQKLEEQVQKISIENDKLKNKPKKIKMKLEMSPLKAKFLQPFFVTQQKECAVEYVVCEKSVFLTGPENIVKEFQHKLIIEQEKIKENVISISEELLLLLSGDRGKKFLLNLDLNGALTELVDSSLKVAARDESALSNAATFLKAKLDCKETLKAENIPPEKFKILKLKLEQELLVVINYMGNEINITGVSDDFKTASKSVNTFLDEIKKIEQTFLSAGPEAKYLFHFMEEKIDSILKPMKILEKSITEQEIFIRYLGRKCDVSTVDSSLKELQKNIKCSVWLLKEDFKDYELFLIARHYLSEQKNFTSYDYKEKYLITFQIAGTLKGIALNQNKVNIKSCQKNPAVAQLNLRETVQESMTLPVDWLTFKVNNICQLIIKQEGDIVREDSDILVSVLGTDIDMKKTAVGQAFNKICPNHWKEVKAYHDSNPYAKIIIVQKPEGLNCLAVCHIILSPWNPSSSRGQLAAALGNVLDEAKCFGAKSISFPPLGCGRIFRFPPEIVAEVMIKSFKENDIGSFLQDVILLSPEQKLFNELKTSASECFTSSVSKRTVQEHLSSSNVLHRETTPYSPVKSDNNIDCINIQSQQRVLYSSQIIIYTQPKTDVGSLKIQKKKEIKEELLQTDVIEEDFLTSCPENSWKKILKEATKHNIWVEKNENPSKRSVKINLTGQKEKLISFKAFIHLELQNVSSHLPKKRLNSAQAPKRGTIEFLRYASNSDEHFPSYWALNNNENYWEKIKSGKTITKSEFHILVDVDKATKDALSNLFSKTQDLNRIGHGADAKGLKYSTLKVTDVKRVENLELFETYRRERALLFKKMIKMGKICERVENLPGSFGDVATAQWLPDFMKKELYYEINEHYLFHGAKTDSIITLVNNGIDPRVSNESCMFGKGIYTAEKSTKADQYSDKRDARVPNGTPLKIILTRMLLGNIFLCDDTHKSVVSKEINPRVLITSLYPLRK